MIAAATPDNDHAEVCCKIVQETLCKALKGFSIFSQYKIDQTIRSESVLMQAFKK